MSYQHKWAECSLCGPMIVCGKCGNNCCNAGYGTVDGVDCDECPKVYEMARAEWDKFSDDELRAKYGLSANPVTA